MDAGRAYRPVHGLACEEIGAPFALEADPQSSSPGTCRGRGLRRRAAVLSACACAAAAAVAALAVLRPPVRRGEAGHAAVEQLQAQELWEVTDTFGPCPPDLVKVGGVPRTPEFATVPQAWVCLDRDNNGKLDVPELGPGATVAGVDYHVFQEHIRQDRDLLLRGLPAVALDVARWSEPGGQKAALVQPHEDADPARLPPADAGQVVALYTFGAPPVSREVSVKNNARQDGCFPGLRVYTRGSHKIEEYQVRLQVADPIAWIMSAFGYRHAQADVLGLNEANAYEAGYSECQNGYSGPQADFFYWFDGHSARSYATKLEELDGLLADNSWHKPVVKSLVNAEANFQHCSAHADCAALAGSDPMKTCCPSAEGVFMACCKKVSPVDAFPVDVSFGVGDYVRVNKNETEVKRAFARIVYIWKDGMQNMLGEVFPIVMVLSPGLVALPSTDGSNDGVWYFPTAAVVPVSAAEADTYRRKQAGTTPARSPSTPASSNPAVASPPRPNGRRDKIHKAVVYQQLAAIAFQEHNMRQFMDAQDYDFALIAHAVEEKYEQSLNPMASLFQDATTNECVLAFGLREHPNMAQNSDATQNAAYYESNPILSRTLFLWWNLLASWDVGRNDNKVVGLEGQHTGRPEDAPLPVMDDENCTVRTAVGLKPCNVGNVTGAYHITRAIDFCGIPGVQEYFALGLKNFTRSMAYRELIAKRLPSCQGVTAVGHDIGGAFATLWAACANAGLQPGEAGYEDQALIAWRSTAPAKLTAMRPDDEELAENSFSLRNRKTGKMLELAGHLQEVQLGRGTLILGELGEDTIEQRWELTEEGYIRSPHSGKCLGPVGDLGSGRATQDGGIGAKVALSACEFNVLTTHQIWNFSSHGFLVNEYTGLCLSADMTMQRCPMSDQVWHLRTDGFIVNEMSGLCLDIQGDPGTTNGDKASLWPCEYGRWGTDQRWELHPLGFLKNKQSGRCLDVQNLYGVFTSPTLVLWDCVLTLSEPTAQQWQLTKEGFIESRPYGKCIGLTGGVQAQQGAEVVLSACERYHAIGASALWELLPNGRIVNRGEDQAYRGRCLAAASDDGVELGYCSTHLRQSFMVSPQGRISTALGLGVCIDDTQQSLGLHPCVDGQTDQVWMLTSDGFLMNRATRKCIGVGEDSLTVKEDFCHITDQRWTLEAGHLKNRLSGRCADVRGGPPNDLQPGAPMVLWECERKATVQEASDQRWEAVPVATGGEQLHNRLSNLCLDVEGEPPANSENGARLISSRCNATRASQVWQSDEQGFYRNVLSGKCIDVDGEAGHSDGEVLVLYTCESDPSNYTDQTWELVGEPAAVAKFTQDLQPAGRTSWRPAFQPEDNTNSAEVKAAQAAGTAARRAGAFVTFGREVWWSFRGYKHLVPGEVDCAQCGCRTNMAIIDQAQVDALIRGKDYDCRLQDIADMEAGFKREGFAAVDSTAAAALYPDNSGRFISDGTDVYWQYNGQKHKVPPGYGCDQCGCKHQFVTLSREQVDSIRTGKPFMCAMKHLAAYGALFEPPGVAVVTRFITAGRHVYWQHGDSKHLVPPEIGCAECGCFGLLTMVSEDELAGYSLGEPFNCTLAVGPGVAALERDVEAGLQDGAGAFSAG